MAGDEVIIEGIRLGEGNILSCFEIKIHLIFEVESENKLEKLFHKISLFLIIEFGQASSVQIHEPLWSMNLYGTNLANT